MAMSVTTTEHSHGSVKRIVFAWTSAADGTASATTGGVYDGAVVALTTVPDGTAAPTDNYDVAVTDGAYDVLLGQGTDRDTTTTEHVTASLGAVSASKLSLSITNAGDTKKGTVVLWIR